MTLDVVTTAELGRLWRAGELPVEVARAMNVREAARLVEQLPDVQASNTAMPRGFGLWPPRGAEPIVRLSKRARDAYGTPVRQRAHGVIGCLWRWRGRVVFRLWFKGEPTTNNPHGALRGPVDVFEDQIGAVQSLEGIVPFLVGWEVGRLDGVDPGDA